LRELRKRAVTSPCRSNHLEVVVLFRVLPGREVASYWVTRTPVWHSHSPNALPCRYSVFYPYPKTRLLGHSSLEVQPSFMVSDQSPRPEPLGPEQLSWDLLPLQHIQATRVHVRTVLPAWLSELVRRPPQRSSVRPTSPTTAPLIGFFNLSATYSSHCPPTIFRQVAFMGFTLQGFHPSAKPPAAHHRRITLVPLLPPVAQSQGPRPGIPLGVRSDT
jgi:hypothetical protein